MVVVSVCREWGYQSCRSPQMMGGLGGSTLPLLVCGSFPAAAGGCLPGRDRGRHYRKGFSQAAGTTSTSHSRIIRNSSCDPAMCETRRRAGKGMGGRSWQKHGGSGGFWYCAEDNDHRCVLRVDDEAQVRSIDQISVWRCSRRDFFAPRGGIERHRAALRDHYRQGSTRAST